MAYHTLLWPAVALLLLLVSATTNPYRVDETTVRKNDTGISFMLVNTAPSASADPKNKEITKAFFSLDRIDESVLHVMIKDAEDSRWEVPELCTDYKTEFAPKPLSTSRFMYTNSPFSWWLADGADRLVEFFPSTLRYFDKYIEFDTNLQTSRVFGLGERCAHFALPPGLYTLWNHGQPNPFDDGVNGGKNLYGSHPVYVTQLRDKSKFLGVYFKNSNAQDVLVEKAHLVHKTIGGIIELYVFYPDSMEGVMKKYHTLIGKPYLPAFWSFGSQQSKWGYRSIWDMKRAIRSYEHYDIPIDALTLDIDYMHEYEIFTVDTTRYPNMTGFVDEMHAKDINLVVILDPGIRQQPGYPIYDMAVQKKALLRSAKNPPFVVGDVWPGLTVFPDYWHPDGVSIWKYGLELLLNVTHFDGLMLDMMDIESFCQGECPNGLLSGQAADGECKYDAKNHAKDEFDTLPYTPGGRSIEVGTLSASGYHCAHNENEDRFLKEYNVHNLFAFNESRYTNEKVVPMMNRRAFLLPRSTVPGSGHFASHWQGDNWATWGHMRMSVPGLYSFQLFGIPHVGVDMCGFAGNGDSELCARWYQVGSFCTFTRNHNIRTVLPQEPWWYLEDDEDHPNLVINTARMSLRQKYSLLRLYYTRMIQVHMAGGYVVGPSYFEFPTDDTAFSELEQSIMVAKSVLVSLALYPGQKTIDQYLPNADWYELRTGKREATYSASATSGTRVSLEASFDYINLHIKGGSVVPYQDCMTEHKKIVRAKRLLELPIDLLIALDTDQSKKLRAQGEVILEDGITPDIVRTGGYKRYRVDFSDETGTSRVVFTNLNSGCSLKFVNEQVKRIKIYGLATSRTINGATLTYINGQVVKLNIAMDKENGIAVIENADPISMEVMKEIKLLENVQVDPSTPSKKSDL